jgi:hypothetical protein
MPNSRATAPPLRVELAGPEQGGGERLCREVGRQRRRTPPLSGEASNVAAMAAEDGADLAEALELRDELLIACREVLLQVGSRQASSLVAAIDALLDLDDELSSGSQR